MTTFSTLRPHPGPHPKGIGIYTTLALASRGVGTAREGGPRGITLQTCGVRFSDLAPAIIALGEDVIGNCSGRGAYGGSRRDQPGGSLGRCVDTDAQKGRERP
jgi:hypothetical protein